MITRRAARANTDSGAPTIDELNRRYAELAAFYAGMPDEEGLEIILATRQIIDGWLERNIEHNRSERPRDQEKIGRDMAAEPSRWKFNGDTVKLTRAGAMMDGQQRCKAFLLAQELNPRLRYIRVGVAFNIDPEALLVTDTGAKRLFKDWLRLKGQQYLTNASAVVRRVFEWELGNYTDQRGYGAVHGGFIQPTEAELADFWEPRRQQFEAAMGIAMDAKNHVGANTTAVGTAYFVLRQIDDGQAKGFFENFVSGANLGAKDPVKKVREKIMRAGRRGADKADRLTATEQLYLLMQAWQVRREDGTIPGQRYTKLGVPGGKPITNANFIRPE